MSDNRFIGELIGDDMEGAWPDLIGDDEMGIRRKRLRRIAHRHGLALMPAQEAMQARAALAQQAQMQAAATGHPVSAGFQLAASDQAELYLPFQSATLGNALGATAQLQVTVQRPTQLHRLVLASYNSAGGDDLGTVGIDSVLVGVQPVFNAEGVAPAQAFAFNAVGVRLLCFPARVGTVVTVKLVRLTPGNGEGTTIVTGLGIGVSAQV